MDTSLQKFVKLLGEEPPRVRKSFLAAVAATTRAANAFLLVPGEGTVFSWKKQPLPQDLHHLMQAFEKSTRHFSKTGKVLLTKLKSQIRNTQPVVLALFFAREPRSNTRIRHSILLLCKIYMWWEVSQNLRNTIEQQQKTLHSLSAESAVVAQEYVRLTQQMQVNQQRLQGITKGILRTQEEERAKISRDLHDGIGQELTALKMNIDILSPLVEQTLEPDNKERWREARSIAERALQDVRELSRLLRPRMLDDLGLFPTLRWYVRSFSKRVNILVSLDLDGDEEVLSSDTQTILFRVVQEALNNVAKHSQAKSARVELHCRGQEVRLLVWDDGVGFDTQKKFVETGSGLAGMRDRISLYRGTFHVQSEPMKGTRLNVVIPVAQ